MKIKNALILYKKSSYEFYFHNPNRVMAKEKLHFTNAIRMRFKKAHDAHYKTLAVVKKVLRDSGISFKSQYRGRKISYKPFDFVITVGGDGTFLEAARSIKRQFILGVNSDPKRSIGRLCRANRQNFKKIIEKMLRDQCKIKILDRLALKLNHGMPAVNVLNDILVCHQNPATMSRYLLTIGAWKEIQRSSGLWIATATGSSGAIRSAGGTLMAKNEGKIQYLPRELFAWRKTKYRLNGGILKRKTILRVRSLMRNGAIYIDGAHSKYPFSFGDTAYVTISPQSLKTVIC